MSKAAKATGSAASPPETPACFTSTQGVVTTTMNDLPGHRVVRVLGTIYGLTVQSRNWGADLGAIMRSIVGGEIRLFTNLMYTSRNKAEERLVGECLGRGGNAVLAMRFDVAELCGFSQVCAYGTACVVERVE